MTTFTGHLTDAQAQRLLDGALLEAEAAEVERHLSACEGCQALVASYSALGEALEEALAVPDLPADFTAGVLARVDARARAAARERRFAMGICAAVAVALVLVAALAGAGTWAPLASRVVSDLGAAGQALRIGVDVVGPIVTALRLQLALLCAGLALPVLFLLSRLMPSPSHEVA
jgi:anti-sigma factor RsiW